MKFLIKALLAATALLPAATASAQEGRRERSESRGDSVQQADRGERRAMRQAMQQSPERAERQAMRQAGQQSQEQFQRQAQRQPQDRGDRGGSRFRPLPGTQVEARPQMDRRFAQGQPPREIQGGRADRDSRQSFGDYGRSTGGWDRQRDDRRRDDRDGGRRYDRNDRRDDGRFADNGWNRRGQDWRGGQRFDNRQNWNRTWRNDRRYDWGGDRANNRSAYRLPRYYAPSNWGYGYRRFGIGVTLDQRLWGQNYWIEDPYSYRLPEAYGPYRWVRYYNDALLVDVRYGEVIDVVHDIFW